MAGGVNRSPTPLASEFTMTTTGRMRGGHGSRPKEFHVLRVKSVEIPAFSYSLTAC